MPLKRKASIENQLPPITDLLREHPLSPKGAKRARSEKKTVPLADISNSPGPIMWTAFGAEPAGPGVKTVPYDYQPLKGTRLDSVKKSLPQRAPRTNTTPVTVPSSTISTVPHVESPIEMPVNAAPAVKQGRIVKPAPLVTKKPATISTKPNKPGIIDISDVHLDGEDTDSVAIFDTCDVIRRKINHALSSTPHTKASLLRSLAACTSTPSKPIPATSFIHFMNAKGKFGGIQSRVFYAGYVYFEKVRIAEGKKKTKPREEMEAAWGSGGMDRNIGKPMLVGPGEDFVIDKYGRETIVRSW